jgi:hypothetical protein
MLLWLLISGPRLVLGEADMRCLAALARHEQLLSDIAAERDVGEFCIASDLRSDQVSELIAPRAKSAAYDSLLAEMRGQLLAYASKDRR